MKRYNIRIAIGLLAIVVISGLAVQTYSHCQIPCGIYDDPVRFTLLKEHVTTLEKSIKQIEELSAKEPEKNMNQIVRWVQNKDSHADAFTEIVTQYFLTQRIKSAEPSDKAAYEAYTHKLVLLHQMTVNAMKAKQTTDLQCTEALKKLVEEFQTAYEKS